MQKQSFLSNYASWLQGALLASTFGYYVEVHIEIINLM
jgi:predicted outer membrane lipoprotein